MTPESMNADKGTGETSGVSPWLASLMMQRGGTILPRFALYYRRLSGMSRPWRRRLRQKLAVTVTGAALLMAIGGGVAWAEPAAPDNLINVANGEVGIANNGICSLIEAINNANNTANGRPHTDCAAGNPGGADTVILPANGVFTLTNVFRSDNTGEHGLPWITSRITLNGAGSTIQRSGSAPAFRILSVGRQGNLTLNNATVRGGYINAYSYTGGGILNQGVLTISGSTIRDNQTYSFDLWADGGGIYNDGTLTISGSSILNNEANGYASTYGGGINGTGNGSLTILDSQISGNYASGVHGAGGGGVYAVGSLTIQNSTFENNTASGFIYGVLGGAVHASGDTLISGSTFTNNLASGSDYYHYGMGGAISNLGVMTISNSTLSANEATSDGGGLVNYRGDMTVVNTTITGNSGGGVFVGGGYGNTTTRFRRTIVSGNTSGEVKITNDGGTHTVIANKHNIFGRNGNAGVTGFSPGATDIVPAGALSTILSPLASNGGPTQTHALPANSPARDRAPNTDCTVAPVNGVDQRGEPRNQNGSGASSSNECDVGAYEAKGGGEVPGFYLSATTAGTVGGVAFVPADILKFDPTAGWSMYFDGSDVGITKNVSAFEIQNDGSILLSLAAGQTVAGAGAVAPHDVIRFAPVTTGNNTSGTFQMWVDGSNVGLTTASEKIDALGLASDGRLAISTMGAIAVAAPGGGTLKGQDEDALGFNRNTVAWSALFNGTAIPGLGVEDVNALWLNPATGEIYISIVGTFNLGGVAGNGQDIVKLSPSGASGGYTASLVFDGSAQGFPANIDGLEMVP